MKRDDLLRGWALKAYTVQNSRRLLFGALAMTFLGVGCTKAAMYDTRFTPTDLAPEDAVTVVLSQFSGEFSAAKEAKFVRCITKAIHKAHPTVRIVPADEFRQAAFPDLTPEEIPRGDWTWEQLGEDPAFQQRIAPLGLHYLIAVSGGTTQDLKLRLEGSIAGGALAYIGDRHSRLGATVIDLIQGSNVGRLEVDAKNTTTVGWMILPFPAYVSAPTETRACSELGEGIVGFLDEEPFPYDLHAPGTAPEREAVVFGSLEVADLDGGRFMVHILPDAGATPVSYIVTGDGSFYWHLPPGGYTITGFQWNTLGWVRRGHIFAHFTVPAQTSLVYVGTLVIYPHQDRVRIQNEYNQARNNLRNTFPTIKGEATKSVMHLRKVR